MRKTGPVTQKEVTFGPEQQLVTSTTAKGVITFCNDDFCRIAGYSREELMGQAHNVVRHPDMPAAAFKAMWDNLKAGTPWMGLVKNRCANGDHYWVDAYVTPVRENGQVVGHESVRFAPTREQIERATYAYARLNRGQSAVPWLREFWEKQKLTFGVFVLAWIAFKVCLTLADDFNWMTATLATVTSLVVAAGTSWLKTLHMAKVLEVSRSVVHDKLAAYIYTGRSDAYGEVLLAQYICQARIRTALGRFSESAKTLTNKSTAASDQAAESLKAMSAQQAESAQVAESMTQMTIAVQEVAAGVSATSASAMDAMTQVKAGESVTLEASREINELSTMVERLSDVMGELSGGSEKIASVIDVIRSIADQTNLLALNAAIEAARAGEQGRGFSVVADEVRSLAQRTQESTQSIQEIIESLGKSTGQAADNMATCRERSHRSVESIGKVNEALTAISQTAASIERQTQQMAAAAEEQSAVAVEVDKNVKNISEISTSTQGLAQDTAKLSNEMRELSDVQFNLIDRFK